MLKTRKQFITSFNLKAAEKVDFIDGTRMYERTKYVDPFGNEFVFFNNDLKSLKSYINSRGIKIYRLSAGYSWYHK